MQSEASREKDEQEKKVEALNQELEEILREDKEAANEGSTLSEKLAYVLECMVLSVLVYYLKCSIEM